MRVLRAISLALIVASVTFAVVTRELGLGGLNLLLFGLFQWISWSLPRKPHLFNFPEKERFLALPAEYRAPVVAEMRLLMEVVTLTTVAMLLMIQWLMWYKSTGRSLGSLELLPHLAFLLTPLTLVFLLRVTAATERAEKRWKSDVAATGPMP